MQKLDAMSPPEIAEQICVEEAWMAKKVLHPDPEVLTFWGAFASTIIRTIPYSPCQVLYRIKEGLASTVSAFERCQLLISTWRHSD